MSIDITASPARVAPERLDVRIPALVHTGWASELPWLVQGTTTRGATGAEFDLGLFSRGVTEATARANWDRLLARTRMKGAVHAPQPHGCEVRWHPAARVGFRLQEPCDGHATDRVDVLLTVSTADCVPVFVVATEARAVAAVHAGWRGVAGGVLERGLETLARNAGVQKSSLRVHLGPAVCGECYEVGPEVFEALGLAAPDGPRPVDLRRVLAVRAVAGGVDPSNLTTSEHCTRCTGSGLFSRRGGDRGCQVGYIGVRP